MIADEYKVEYRKRYPVSKVSLNGERCCRGCGTPISHNNNQWCSIQCRIKYHPNQVRRSVFERDKDVCRDCGYDCALEYKKWSVEKYKCGGVSLRPRPLAAEQHHVVPVSMGGKTVKENIVTLCEKCHKKYTSETHRKPRKKLIHIAQ